MTQEELNQEALWYARDRRYARARNEITDAMVNAVRWWRSNEAVSDFMRDCALAWNPPRKAK